MSGTILKINMLKKRLESTEDVIVRNGLLKRIHRLENELIN